MTPTEAERLDRMMRRHITQEAKKANVEAFLDTYDLDWFTGALMAWLDQRDLALTGSGLRKIRSIR